VFQSNFEFQQLKLNGSNVQRTQTPLPPSTLCEGFSYHWSLGTTCRIYSLPLHDPSCRTKPGFTLLFIDPSSSIIHVRALTCQGSSSAGSKSCLSCQDETLTKRVKVVEDHARKAPAYLNFTTLSHEQCRKYVGNIGKRWKTDRCKVRLCSRRRKTYIYCPPGFECYEGVGACPRPRKDELTLFSPTLTFPYEAALSHWQFQPNNGYSHRLNIQHSTLIDVRRSTSTSLPPIYHHHHHHASNASCNNSNGSLMQQMGPNDIGCRLGPR
jgi:hypothetical protein